MSLNSFYISLPICNISRTNNITMGQSSSKTKMGFVRVKQCLNPETSITSAQKELFRKEKWELGMVETTQIKENLRR